MERIDDFGGWPKDSDGMMKSRNKLKEYKSAEGAGGLEEYPDSTEEIRRDQERGESLMKRHKQKSGYRY